MGLTIEDQEFDILEKGVGVDTKKNIVKLKNGHDGSTIYGPREKGPTFAGKKIRTNIP